MLFADLWDTNATLITVLGLKAVGKADIVDIHSMGKYNKAFQWCVDILVFFAAKLHVTYEEDLPKCCML